MPISDVASIGNSRVQTEIRALVHELRVDRLQLKRMLISSFSDSSIASTTVGLRGNLCPKRIGQLGDGLRPVPLAPSAELGWPAGTRAGITHPSCPCE
jgi:hypothetical protein